MKIFLDTAELTAIETWAFLVDGITTNPTHMSKTSGDPVMSIRKICKLMQGKPVSVEVTESDPEAVYHQAKKIAALADNVVVKIPCHAHYYSVIQRLVHEHIPLNITLVFSLTQGLYMCKLGVQYISPFIGRLDDTGEDGMQLIYDLRAALDWYGYQTELLAASLRSVEHLQQVILAGVDVATVPVKVFEASMHHDLTDQGMKKFLEDWKNVDVKQFP